MENMLTIDRLKDLLGKQVGISDWMEITQDRIKTFAECTEDRQWIHVDEERARLSPFRSTIAHSFLILSLLPYFCTQSKIAKSGIKMMLNYGLNRVRFVNPVPSGARIRNKANLKDIQEKDMGRILVTIENTVEIEGQDKPAMVAEMLVMLFV